MNSGNVQKDLNFKFIEDFRKFKSGNMIYRYDIEAYIKKLYPHLGAEYINDIWIYSDRDRDQKLNAMEFSVFMKLLQMKMQNIHIDENVLLGQWSQASMRNFINDFMDFEHQSCLKERKTLETKVVGEKRDILQQLNARKSVAADISQMIKSREMVDYDIARWNALKDKAMKILNKEKNSYG